MNDEELKKLLFEISMHKSTIEKMKQERFTERVVTWVIIAVIGLGVYVDWNKERSFIKCTRELGLAKCEELFQKGEEEANYDAQGLGRRP
jgi:hypothetical protein